MNYQVFLRDAAQKSLSALPRDDYTNVRNAILELADNPRPHGCKKLRDRDGWRIRVGKYRVIYRVDDTSRIVRVTHVGHRGDVYRHN
jgi:mRNA interferase RelE/StbE